LVQDIQLNKTMTVGCLGAEAILSALAENGRNDVAYALAGNTNKGCWGYWIKEYNSTTALESFANNWSSNNHAFLIGGLSAWFYKHLAGIAPMQPGFGHIRIKPFIPAHMNRASAQVRSVRGLVKSGWQKSRSRLALSVTIPPNATAEIHIPVEGLASIAYDDKHYAIHADKEGLMKLEEGFAIFKVGSGNHDFWAEYSER
ncbi:MAG: hypothetical protein K0Q63_494, partial [Paenibacillus sp.]|nr:hypothetical protein [Paenibacillus sp.]